MERVPTFTCLSTCSPTCTHWGVKGSSGLASKHRASIQLNDTPTVVLCVDLLDHIVMHRIRLFFINSTMCLHTVQVNNQMSNLRQVLWCLAIQGYSNGWHWFHTLIDEWPAPHPIFVHIDLWRSIVYDFGLCVKLRWLSVRMLHITSSGILFTSSDSA